MMDEMGFPKRLQTTVEATLFGKPGMKPYTLIKTGKQVHPKRVYLHRGVRQGDPAATWEYDLIQQLFAAVIDKSVPPVIANSTTTFTHQEFADDVAIFFNLREVLGPSSRLVSDN
eukprot:TRINITY_DN67977_c10_g2_i2.p1 TRINITY_DN67977_c10_g2~~TRINITY_DN67977_c10_g2_i2.p1  ORF type:complete len:115 (+),score=0.53 TRINITY_DN67977_c10_g2_i2:406-750(+)